MAKQAALKKMSKYLLSGHRMLQVSCPKCEIPLIQDKKTKRIFCANCGKEAKYVRDDLEAKRVEEKVSIKHTSSSVYTELEAILLGKLQDISNKIASETEVGNLLKLLELVQTILDTLKQLEQSSQSDNQFL